MKINHNYPKLQLLKLKVSLLKLLYSPYLILNKKEKANINNDIDDIDKTLTKLLGEDK